MAYPTGTELAAFLVARGILSVAPGDLSDLDDIMTGVCKGWEEDTGFRPFLWTSGTSERFFQLTGGNILFLNSGIYSATGLVIEVNEAEVTIDENFYLKRPADGLPDWPYTQVHFTYEIDCPINGISVTARWGFTDTLPDLVLRALLKKGAAEYLVDIANSTNSLGGSLKRIKQDDVEKEYETTSGQGDGEYEGNLATQFDRAYKRVLSHYSAPWKVMA